MTSILPIVFDEYVDWVLENSSIENQSRLIIEMYKTAAYINDPVVVVSKLDPQKFIFLERGILREHLQIIKDLSPTTVSSGDITPRVWLQYYLNPIVLTRANVSRMNFQVCKVMLTQLKSWYENAVLPACCLINYIDQIKMILCQSHTPEYIKIFNGLVEIYEADIIKDCSLCLAENIRAKRDAKIKAEKAVKNITKK